MQTGLSFSITYVSPARMQSQSKQQKCFRCQLWPSACVYSLQKISCGHTCALGRRLKLGAAVLNKDWSRSRLVTARTPRLLAVPVVASAVQLALLPEVDHVHQQLFAGAAHEAGGVPQLVVTGPLGVDGRLAQAHRLPAVLARLERQ